MDLKKALQQLQDKGELPSPKVVDGAKAPLIELFHSVQGEGRFVGVPMTFLRVATCPLRCLYCDTPNSYEAPPRWPVRGLGRELFEPNPVASHRAADLVWKVQQAAAAAQKPGRLSITGGEPLVFPQFVKEVGRFVRQKGMRLHLETAAIDPAALEVCVDQVDHLSADYKLPETLGAPAKAEVALAPGGSYGALHRRCCEVALKRGATVDVKMVVTDRVMDASVERALEELGPVREKVLLVLQPVTPFGVVTRKVGNGELDRFLAMAVRAGFDVRVLPQVHKVLQIP
jgi:7-carboxy-7-deazaguanine synthase